MLFWPKDKTTRIVDMYSELSTDPVFKDLTLFEDRFVWLFACKSSPLVDKDSKEKIVDRMNRAVKATDLACEHTDTQLDSKAKQRYYNCKFQEHVKTAVEKMGKFDPVLRKQAGNSLEKMLENLIAIANTDYHDFIKDADGNLDGSKLNSYMGAAQKLREEIPAYTKLMEDNMGISTKVERAVASGKTPMEVFMEQKRAQK